MSDATSGSLEPTRDLDDPDAGATWPGDRGPAGAWS
jgi:hypothetical protein